MVPRQQPVTGEQTHRLSLPDGLSTARSKLVYLTLALEGSQTVSQLSERLQLGVSELYPVLRVLRDQGHVTRRDDRYELGAV